MRVIRRRYCAGSFSNAALGAPKSWRCARPLKHFAHRMGRKTVVNRQFRRQSRSISSNRPPLVMASSSPSAFQAFRRRAPRLSVTFVVRSVSIFGGMHALSKFNRKGGIIISVALGAEVASSARCLCFPKLASMLFRQTGLRGIIGTVFTYDKRQSFSRNRSCRPSALYIHIKFRHI